jgi:hypothetical protein
MEGTMLDRALPPPPAPEETGRRRVWCLTCIAGVLGSLVLAGCSDIEIKPPPDNCQYKCGH